MAILSFCCVAWALWKLSEDILSDLIHAHSDGAGMLDKH